MDLRRIKGYLTALAASLKDRLLAPVGTCPAFFFAATALGAVAPLALALLCGQLRLRFTAFALCQSAVLAYAACVLMRRCRVARMAFLCVLAAWAAIEAGHTAMLGRCIDASSVSLAMDTNPAEAGGFFRQYFSAGLIAKILLFFSAMAAAPRCGRMLWMRLRHRPFPSALFAAALAVALPVGAIGIAECASVWFFKDYDRFLIWRAHDNGNTALARVYRMLHSDSFTKGLYLAKNMQMDSATLRMWEHVQHGITSEPASKADTDSLTIAVIIGESFIKSHCAPYGYGLPVNPRLQQEIDSGRMVAFTDMISPADFTIQSLRNTLNLNDLADGTAWHDSPFWPLLLRRSGFSVYLYSNQYAPGGGSNELNGMLYSPVLTDCCYTATAERRFDYDHLFTEHVMRNLCPSEHGARKLIIWHLLGQHFPADERLPADSQCRRFTAADITAEQPWLTPGRRAEVADYDNATLYNDSIVGSIIDLYRNTPSVAIYFSDHGEEIWDVAPYGSRNAQHPDDAEWLHRHFDIPFFVWMSPAYTAANPDAAARIKAAAGRPGMLDNLGQAVLGLAHTDGGGRYNPRRDILSGSYSPAPRVTSAGYAYDSIVSE